MNPFQTLTEVAADLDRGVLSSVELTQAMLDRIDRLNPKLHAYLTVAHEAALAAAGRADSARARGESLGALHGVPIAVKDLCDTAGIRTTAGMKIFEERVPETSAAIVERFESAGAVILGKLTTTEGAGALHHPEMPAAVNPWNAAFWAGSSSSGSGSGTAAGLCFGSIGTDTAGSIRYPSACNALVGLKPTFGRVPKHGVFPLSESLDHVGPMARTVRDAARLLGVIAGFDARDPKSSAAPVEPYEKLLEGGVRGMRIGVDEGYLTRNVGSDVSAAIQVALARLETLGARLVPIVVPDLDKAVDAFVPIFHADVLATHEELLKVHRSRYGAHLRDVAEVGHRVTGADYARAHRDRLEFRGTLGALLREVDAFACPPSIGPPPPVEMIEHTPADFGLMKFVLAYAPPYNLAGVPTLTMPCGFTGEGLPLAIQLVAGELREATLLRIAQAYEQAESWKDRHPDV